MNEVWIIVEESGEYSAFNYVVHDTFWTNEVEASAECLLLQRAEVLAVLTTEARRLAARRFEEGDPPPRIEDWTKPGGGAEFKDWRARQDQAMRKAIAAFVPPEPSDEQVVSRLEDCELRFAVHKLTKAAT